MTKQREHKPKKDNKTVVVLAECLNGACEAGGFAARHLFDSSTRIILLHTYKRPRTGIMMMRDITPILKETAEQELRSLRRKLTEDPGIPAENIEMMAIHGELKNVIGSFFNDYSNLSFVLGPGIGELPHNSSCKNTISSLIETGARPIFLISGFITIIEDNKVSVIADKEKNVPQAYLDFLKNLAGKDENKEIEIISSDNRNTVRINKDTVDKFINNKQLAGEKDGIEEHIMIKRMER